MEKFTGCDDGTITLTWDDFNTEFTKYRPIESSELYATEGYENLPFEHDTSIDDMELTEDHSNWRLWCVDYPVYDIDCVAIFEIQDDAVHMYANPTIAEYYHTEPLNVFYSSYLPIHSEQ